MIGDHQENKAQISERWLKWSRMMYNNHRRNQAWMDDPIKDWGLELGTRLVIVVRWDIQYSQVESWSRAIAQEDIRFVEPPNAKSGGERINNWKSMNCRARMRSDLGALHPRLVDERSCEKIRICQYVRRICNVNLSRSCYLRPWLYGKGIMTGPGRDENCNT